MKLCFVLGMALLSLPVTAGAQSNHSQLFFDSSGTDQAAYGANQIITISGNVTYYGRRDPRPDEPTVSLDFVQPVSDVYVVPAGWWRTGVQDGLKLEDVNDVPNTILGAGSGGFFEEPIATTHPGGSLISGDYDIVFDEHQDGFFQSQLDFYLGTKGSPAFTVRVPADAPKLPVSGIKAMKLKATRQYEAAVYLKAGWETIQGFQEPHSRIVEAVTKLAQGTAQPDDFSLDYKLILKEPVVLFYSAFIKLRNEVLPQFKHVDDFMAMPFSAANAAIASKMKRGLGLAADPPDPDFAVAVTLPAPRPPVGTNMDPLTRAMAAAGAVTDEEQRLAAGLLAALEKYQGADAANDPRWCLAHARTAQHLATLLEAQTERSLPALTALRQQLASYPFDLDAVAAVLTERQAEVRTQGWSPEVKQFLAGLGASGAEMDAARDAFASLDFSFSRVRLLAALDAALAANGGPAGYAELASSLDDTIATLLAEPTLDKGDPLVSLAAAFTGTARSPLILTATGSDPLGRPVEFDWDLDGDGVYGDASGAEVSTTWPAAFNGHVGVRITNAAGRAAFAWAHVTVTDANRAPVMAGLTPLSAFVTSDTGIPLAFHAEASDPDGDPVSMQWLLNGEPVAEGADFAFTPTAAQAGVYALLVKATDGLGGETTHVWLLAIGKPGAALADLSVTMEAPETPVQTGAEFTWTMTLENRGPSAAENVVVTQALPDGLSFVRASTSFGTASGGGSSVIANLGTLAAGGRAAVLVQTTAAAAGSYSASVNVRSDAADPVPGNNNAAARVRVNPPSPQAADVRLAAAVAPSPATVGGTQTLTFTTTNAGPDAATGLVLETQLPESVDFVSSMPAALSNDDGLVRIALPDVANGANTVATVVVRPALAGSGPAYAQVYAAQGDPLLSNNQTEVLLSAVFTPPPVSDLVITQTPPLTPRAGLPATWTITVTNNGPDAAEQVSLNDVLPAGAAFSGASPAPASLGNGRASFSLGTIASGASRSVSLTVEPQEAGELTNRVTASSASRDANGAESVSSVVVLSEPATTADISVTIAAPVSSGPLGTGIEFTVTTRNDGPDSSTGVRTVVQLPEGMSFVSATGGASHLDGIISLSLPSLASGADVSFTFVATPGIAAPLGVVATAASEDLDPDAADNRALLRVQGLDSTASVAIIRNYDDPEISTIQGYLNEMSLTSQVFDKEAVTGVSLQPYRLVIWNDLSYASFGVRPPLIELLQGVADAGKPIYFIGDDLAYVINFALVEPHATIWENLIHLKRTDTNFGSGGMTIINTHHPVTGGIYGEVGDSGYLFDPDDTSATGQPGETVLGRSNNADSVVAFRDPVTFRKSLTQNELVYTQVATEEGRGERKKLFKNGVAWLLSEDVPVNLALTQSARSSVTLGNSVKITITASNRGSGTASTVTLRQTLPTGLAFGSASSSRGLVTHDAGVVTAELGLLAANESVTVEVILSAAELGTATIPASVSSGEPESFAPDNFSSLAIAVLPAGPVTLKATYRFDDTLAACEPDTPPLVAIDPANTDAFATVDVNGRTRRAYRWDGSPDPASAQAGLKLNTAGLLPRDNYSVEMLFRFNEANNATRSILQTANRVGDHSLYVSPQNRLVVSPLTEGPASFTTGKFHHVALTVSGGTVTTWLDGVLQRTETTGNVEISPEDLLHFFVDNHEGAAQNDYADGEIALLRVYEGALPPNRIAAQAAYPFGPDEPMSANADLTAVQNPLGVWHCGYSTSRGTPFLHSTNVMEVDTRWIFWGGTSNGPWVYHNRLNETVSSQTIRQPPDLLGMDPSLDGRNAVVRWTAPAGGTYRIQGRWQGIDVSPNGTDVALLRNGSTATTLFEDYVLGYEERKPFDLTVILNMGETVDFSLGRGGNSNLFDSTGLDAVITPVALTDDCADGTDLVVTHTPLEKTVAPGETFALELSVANAGLRPAPGVILTDIVPVGLTFVSATAENAIVQPSGNGATLTLGMLAPGETRAISVLLTGNTEGVFTNVARVTGESFDPALENNETNAAITVGGVVPLVATVRTTVDSARAGDEVVFELVMANTGTLAAPDSLISALLPEGAAFISATGGGTLQNDTIVFPARSLAVGETAGYSLRLRANVPGPLSLTALASSTHPSVRESTGNASLTILPVTVPPDLQIAVSTMPAQLHAGCRFTATYTVTNTSPTPAADVTLRGFIPSTLVVISTTASQGTATVTDGQLDATLGQVRQGTPVTVTVQALATAAEATGLSASVSGMHPLATIPAAIPASLVHLWDFNESAGAASSDIVLQDRVGAAHGTVRGSGALTTGSGVQLPGGDPASAPYIDLPSA